MPEATVSAMISSEKEKLPDGEGARATRRANKISVISLDSLAPSSEQKTNIALQLERSWIKALDRPDIVLFAYPSTSRGTASILIFAPFEGSSCFPPISVAAPLHSCLSAIVVTVGFLTLLQLRSLLCLILAMEKFLRSWRQDALNRGQHDAAIYIGDKVLALTSKMQHTNNQLLCMILINQVQLNR